MFDDFIVSLIVTGETTIVLFFIAVDFMGCGGVVATLDVLLDTGRI